MLSAVVISLALCASTAVGQSVCGQTPVAPNLNGKFDNEIVGGSNAVPYSWPWQIVWCRTSGGSCSLMCGGSIINNNWIMTAAHCARGQNPANIKIKAGVYNEASTTESGMLMIQVAEIRIHPNYNPNTMVYDIALARLSQPLAYSQHIQPVCLPSSDSGIIGVASNDAYVTGWGTTSSGGSISQTLRQVRVPFVPFTTCNSASEYHGQVSETTMLCAGVGGKDSCQGDSGGPLVTQSGSNWYQYGIVSWGIGCAQSNHPGIYSRVTAFCSFISSTTGGAAACR